MILEICAGSLSSALNARLGGAHRIELCDNLSEGGTTPSPGMIRQVVKLLDIPVFVLIRPRTGDFLYSSGEFEVMREDILFCKVHGAKGVVLGILKADGSVDLERMKALVELARPMQVTFHRAFDLTGDPFRAMEDIISVGISRILTSGQAANVLEGAGLIADLISKAGQRIIIMPGGGITEENILAVKNRTKAIEIHGSLRSQVQSRMEFRNEKAFMGRSGENEYTWLETDKTRVNMLVKKLKSI